MDLYLRIKDGVVQEAKFQTFGCGPAIAAGSMLTEMITNRTIAECLELSQHRLIEALGGLPSDKTWCADLAIGALRNALSKIDGKTQ